MVLCRYGCITELCILSWAGSLETKLKSLNFIIKILILYNRVSDVTLGPFLGILCYVLGTKLDSVLPLRMRHKGMKLVLGRFADHKTERFQFYRSLKLKSQLCLAGSLDTKLKSVNFI